MRAPLTRSSRFCAAQVTNQLKILPTAAFSVLSLNRSLRLQQWLSLPLLALGVAVVNLSASAHAPSAAVSAGAAAETVTLAAAQREPRWWIGLAAALAAAVFSGYASVYVERMLKTEQRAAWAEGGDAESGSSGSGGGNGSGNGNGGSCAVGGCASPGGGAGAGGSGSPSASGMQLQQAASGAPGSPNSPRKNDAPPPPLPPPPPGGRPLLSLNLQLAAWGAAISLLQLALFNAPEMQSGALLQHFNGYTWAVIWLQALGGLVVGVVLKYTDNIVKGFATAASILLSCVLESGMSGRMPSFSFVLGLSMVMASFALFSGPEDLLARLLGPTGHALLAAAAADVGSQAMGCMRAARAPAGAGALLAAAAGGAGALALMAMYVHDTSAAGGGGGTAGAALLRAPPGLRAPADEASLGAASAAAAALHVFGAERPPLGPHPEGISSEAGGAGIAAGGGALRSGSSARGGDAASHDDGAEEHDAGGDATLHDVLWAASGRVAGADAAAALLRPGEATSGADGSGGNDVAEAPSDDDATGLFAARLEAAAEHARTERSDGDAGGAVAAHERGEFAAEAAAEDAAAAAVAAALDAGGAGGALRGVVVNASVRAGGSGSGSGSSSGSGVGSASQEGLLPAPSPVVVVGPRDAWLAERTFAEGGLDPAEVAAASAAAAADAAGRGTDFSRNATSIADARAAALRDEFPLRGGAAAARHAARDAAALGLEAGGVGGLGGVARGAGAGGIAAALPAEGERLSGAAAWLATATDQGGAVRTTVRRRLRSGEEAGEATCGGAGGEAC
jgi:UDP-sugar transporter A1/2/3